MTGIYKIECIINHKVYIGQSKNIKDRWKGHIKELDLNKHINNHLQYAWNKYGKENFKFEILELCSQKDLNNKEIYWLNYYGGKDSNNTFNIVEAGKGGAGDENWKTKISNTVKQHYLNGDYDCRKKGTKCWIVKENKMQVINIAQLDNYIKRGWKRGRLPLSEETRKKISRPGKLNNFYGKKHSEETKQKMRKKHNISLESHNLMSLQNSKRFKKLKWINNGEINKRVENVNFYIQQGWKIGRIPLPQIGESLKKRYLINPELKYWGANKNFKKI